ncbi:hypothetical protein NUH87_07345 [Pseudomonas batumici]|uniref:hypothetical protein n=1 Tax=Pseudomonas batumici TaxID=226910 RepID=UPI0030CE0081
MQKDPIVPISDSLSKALERLFKTGGFALAFGFGGLLIIIVSNFFSEKLKLPAFLVGCTLTFVCLFFFLFSNLRTRRITKRIKDDLPLLDSLQGVALQITELSFLTQSFAFKHLSKIQKTIETIKPIIESFPFFGETAKSLGLTDAAKISSVIVGATEATKEIVLKLESAIRSGDLKAVKKYASSLEDALASLRSALKVDT